MITIPILIIVGLNFLYHIGMLFLIEIDLFIGNFVVWIFFGQAIGGGIAIFAITVASIPLVLLPHLWNSKGIWGIAKVGIFIFIVAVSAVISGLISFGALKLLNKFADLRTTLWWAELWGVA